MSNGRRDCIKGVVTKVHDGDTVTFLPDSKSKDELKIRLAEIDTPETDQPCGKEAKEFLKKMALLKDAKIKVVDVDRYGRTVAKLYVGRRCANKALLEQGLAWHYKSYSESAEFARLEASAKAKRKGIFRQKNPTPPWEWRQMKKKEEKAARSS